MSQCTARKLKILLLLSVLMTAGCSRSITAPSACPRPANDLLVKSVDLQAITSAEDAPDVMKHNGDVLLGDRDRVARWQAWWSGCEKR